VYLPSLLNGLSKLLFLFTKLANECFVEIAGKV
jgi:hypothetical protein